MKKICIAALFCGILFSLTACSNGGNASSGVLSSSPVLSGVSSAAGESSGRSASSSPDSLPAETSSAPSSGKPVSGGTSSQAPAEPEQPDTVSLTFPEGFTLAQVGARLEAHNVCKKADFIQAAQTYNFNYYSLVKAIPSSSKRAYKLEGYLYPDTYEMYTNMKPQDAVGKFLRNAEQLIKGRYSYAGMTADQVITLASIIEREADNAADMKKVSSVLHNRLKAGQRLEADSTREYCNQYLLKPNGPFADKFKYYYNTYRCAALPAGPICNPGTAALEAAARPASTGYYYFITANGKYYYQKTFAEHSAKLKELGITPGA